MFTYTFYNRHCKLTLWCILFGPIYNIHPNLVWLYLGGVFFFKVFTNVIYNWITTVGERLKEDGIDEIADEESFDEQEFGEGFVRHSLKLFQSKHPTRTMCFKLHFQWGSAKHSWHVHIFECVICTRRFVIFHNFIYKTACDFMRALCIWQTFPLLS